VGLVLSLEIKPTTLFGFPEALASKMPNPYAEARASFKLSPSSNPNFVTDVFDKWAKDESLQAMLWVSADSRPRVEKYSYKYFADRSHRIACALYKLGLRKGDRVLIMLPRVPAWWEIALGALRMGVVLVPATMLLVSKDIQYRLHACGACAFIGSAGAIKEFMKVDDVPSTLRFRINVEDYLINEPIPRSQQGWSRYSELLASVPENALWRGTSFKAEDPSIIYFTSGTTGMPKMVQHTQLSYPFGCVVTGRYWLKLSPGKLYWNMSEQGWAKAAWSFFATFVLIRCDLF
jgi:medium-chain acyl-CoA synthetase